MRIMTRRLIPCAAAALFILGAPVLPVMAQYPYRGGPINGGPIRGGGPSLFTGAYAPPYYAYPLAGAGYGPSYIGSVPYAGGGVVVGGAPSGVYYPYAFGNSSGVLYPGAQIQPAFAPPLTKPSNPADGPRMSPDIGPPAPPSAGTGRSHFTVKVPADAKLLVNDVETRQTGLSRRFHTPATLETGKAYEYTFRAQWTENAQPVTRDRTVKFKAGDDVTVDFTEAAAR
jgi:uncharacterized protein (TIGR03000 family)